MFFFFWIILVSKHSVVKTICSHAHDRAKSASNSAQSTSLYGKICDLRSTRPSATPRFPNPASTQQHGIILPPPALPSLSSLGFHCLSEEVAVWRQNNLCLLYITGVTRRVLFTQPETGTLRKTAGGVRICLLFFFSPFSQFKLFLFHFCETSTDFFLGGRHHRRWLPTVCVCGGGVEGERRGAWSMRVKVCGLGEKRLLGKSRHMTLSPLPQWRRSGTRAHRLVYCGNRMSPAGSHSKHHYGATAQVYVNIGEMLLTLRVSRISTAHLRAAMWQ